MSRYIDADKLLTDEFLHTLPIGNGRSSGRVVVFADDVEKQPTADVVEVVRCKDCVARPQNYLEPFACARNNILVYGNSFCSYGIRREE